MHRLNGIIVRSDFAALARFVFAAACAEVGLQMALGQTAATPPPPQAEEAAPSLENQVCVRERG